MIGRITGILIQKGSDQVVIDVNGIGYEVFLSQRTLRNLSGVGEKVSIFTELLVREDLLQLVGFQTLEDRDLYRLLISVQGVGSKAALKIMGVANLSVLSRSILLEDVELVKSAQGVGPKLAKRVVTELKDKVIDLVSRGKALNNHLANPKKLIVKEKDSLTTDEAKPSSTEAPILKDNESVEQGNYLSESEAISALSNLGYSTVDAAEAVSRVLRDDGVKELSELIRQSLKILAPKG